jgi:hypothetical protein
MQLNPLEWIKEFALTFVVRGVFEKIPVLSKVLSILEGKKELIGRIGEVLSAVVVILKLKFPELNIGIDEAAISFFVSMLIKYVGMAHAYDKERRGLVRSIGAIRSK